MTKSLLNPFFVDLQLFAEGSDGGTGETGVAAASQTGENVSAAGTVQAEKTYSESELQNIIKQRVKQKDDELRNAQETVDKYNKAAPLFEALATRYGSGDPADIDSITKAVEEDNSFYEDEALEMGVSVEHLREFKRTQRQNKALQDQVDAFVRKQEADKQMDTWMKEAESTKKLYPDFDFSAELTNPAFKEKLKKGDSVIEAFRAVHFDDLMAKAMKYSADTTKADVAADIRARGVRPSENGLSSQGSASVKTEINNLSREGVLDIFRRADRGERIKF